MRQATDEVNYSVQIWVSVLGVMLKFGLCSHCQKAVLNKGYRYSTDDKVRVLVDICVLVNKH